MNRFTSWDWGRYRVVVIDIETTADTGNDAPLSSQEADIHPGRLQSGRVVQSAPEDGFRIVEIAAVTIVDHRRHHMWSSSVKPPIPVDPTSYAFHRISDDELEDAASFADIEPELTKLLQPADGSPVILVAHKTDFDIPILRAEYRRIGLDLPDVPVIDTLDQLPLYVSLERDGRSLPKTCAALQVHHANPHTAVGDAQATAEVFRKLLDYCIPLGVSSFDTLIEELGGITAHAIAADLPSLEDSRSLLPATISASHLATHNVELTAQTLDVWMAGARECAVTACPLLTDKRRAAAEQQSAPVTPLEELDILNALLDHVVNHATLSPGLTTAAFATLLGAWAPLITDLPAQSEQGSGPFAAVRRWGTKWGSKAEELGACVSSAPCPECAAGRVCPNELWPSWLAQRFYKLRLSNYNPEKTKNSELFETIIRKPSERQESSTYAALHKAGLPGVADELLELAGNRLTQDGYARRAASMREEGWSTHQGRGPLLTRWKASVVHATAGPAAAVKLCADTLADKTNCPSGPSRRLLVSAMLSYERIHEQRQRVVTGEHLTPSQRSARSRRQGGRRQPRYFDPTSPAEPSV